MHRSGMTSAPSMDINSEAIQTWLREVSLARTPHEPTQAERGLPDHRADSGIKCLEWFARFDPNSCSWKTRQESLMTETSSACLRISDLPVMWDRQFLYRLPNPVRRLKGNEFSFWPRPLADDADNVTRSSGKIQCMTKSVKEIENWLRPCSADAVGSHGGGQGKSLRIDMHEIVRSGVTDESLLSQIGSGSLNPEFVCWIMGFRAEWINLDASEMQSHRSRPRSRSTS